MILPRDGALPEKVAAALVEAGFQRPDRAEEPEELADADLSILCVDAAGSEGVDPESVAGLLARTGSRALLILDSGPTESLAGYLDLQPEGIALFPISPEQLYLEILYALSRSRPVLRLDGEAAGAPVPREMFDLAPVGIFQTSSDGALLYANRTAALLFGFETAAAAIAYYDDLASQLYVDPSRREEFIKEIRSKGEVTQFVYRARRRDGRELMVELNARISRWLSPQEFLIDGYIVDATERYRRQQRLEEREARYRTLVEASPNAIFVTDRDGVVTNLNAAAIRLFGYKKEELLGKHYNALSAEGEHLEGIGRMFDAVLGGGSFSSVDLAFRRSDGTTSYTLSRIYPVQNESGSVAGVVFANTDITDRRLVELQLREREEHLRELNREKETLLLEIHHRVKNNLQSIISLINLQQGYARDPEDAELFSRSADRVRSMALVHEQLYQSDSHARIDFRQYLETLLREIESSRRGPAGGRFELHSETLFLDLHRAVPCGLIVNELCSNALKHAGGREVTVFVRLEKRDGTIVIAVSDDGPPLPAGFDPQKSGGLGLTLVHSLAEQLHGSMEITSDPGPTFTLIFPI